MLSCARLFCDYCDPRPNMSEMRSYLEGLGATEVIDESNSGTFDDMAKLFEVCVCSMYVRYW